MTKFAKCSILAAAIAATNLPSAMAAETAMKPPSTPAPKPGPEDCTPLDPLMVTAQNTGNDWKVAAGPVTLLDFGPDGAGAQRAVEVIQHYHFTRQCFVRRPNASMMYWKNGVAIPPGNMPDQDCVGLNPAAIELQYVAGSWKIIEGDNWILDYGADRAMADAAMGIIRTYSLNRECFITRPRVAMQYWLAE